MKTKIFTLCLAAFFISNSSFARIFRVGYVGPLVTGVDYDAQGAHNAASDGDTIQFYPGTYEIGTYNKRLFLVGNGYLLSGAGSNTGLNMITGNTSLGIYPTASSTGSNGTVLTGFDYGVVYLSDNLILSNVTITRSNGARFQGFFGMTVKLIDCKITQSNSASIDPSNGNGGNFTLNNFRVENSQLGGSITPIDPSSTILISNCFYGGAPAFADMNVVVQNSIFSGGAGNGLGLANTIFNNNIFDWAPVINGSNNQFNVNIAGAGANVFVGFPNQGSFSNDARFQLTATSPAKGAGVGGVDIGMFGGANPYRLSGIPATPTIYKLQASSPNATTNPYQVTVSVRANN